MSPEDIRKTEWYQNLQADRQSLTELGHQIVELAGHINAAHYRFLMLIAEWDRRKGWNDGASQSCAHWLNCYRPFMTMSGKTVALRGVPGKCGSECESLARLPDIVSELKTVEELQ